MSHSTCQYLTFINVVKLNYFQFILSNTVGINRAASNLCTVFALNSIHIIATVLYRQMNKFKGAIPT